MPFLQSAGLVTFLMVLFSLFLEHSTIIKLFMNCNISVYLVKNFYMHMWPTFHIISHIGNVFLFYGLQTVGSNS